jgi:hypothetical protein
MQNYPGLCMFSPFVPPKRQDTRQDSPGEGNLSPVSRRASVAARRCPWRDPAMVLRRIWRHGSDGVLKEFQMFFRSHGSRCFFFLLRVSAQALLMTWLTYKMVWSQSGMQVVSRIGDYLPTGFSTSLFLKHENSPWNSPWKIARKQGTPDLHTRMKLL